MTMLASSYFGNQRPRPAAALVAKAMRTGTQIAGVLWYADVDWHIAWTGHMPVRISPSPLSSCPHPSSLSRRLSCFGPSPATTNARASSPGSRCHCAGTPRAFPPVVVSSPASLWLSSPVVRRVRPRFTLADSMQTAICRVLWHSSPAARRSYIPPTIN